MRWLVFGWLFVLFAPLSAKSYLLSPLKPPENFVLDIETDSCAQECLQDLYFKGEFFTFVSKFDSEDTALKQSLEQIQSDYFLNALEIRGIKRDSKILKVALLAPGDIIGRYTGIGVSSVFSYLSAQKINFTLEVFDSKIESKDSLADAYARAIDGKFDYVIAMLTQEGAKTFIKSVDITTPTFIPTVNKNQLPDIVLPDNLILGGIDYEKQLEILRDIVGGKSVVRYNDDSNIGSRLDEVTTKMGFNINYSRVISAQDAAHFANQIEDDKAYLAKSAVLFNIPVIKTGLLLSQISQIDSKPDLFLSTQINYNPNLLLLTKPSDRENFYVVNAIGVIDPALLEYGLLLRSDIKYDWVSYSIAVGLDMFYHKHNPVSRHFFSEIKEGSQIIYTNRIYTILDNSFKEVK